MVQANPISKITIRGFKSIRNLEELKLSQLNILIGANGTGKSNFIAYFKLLSEILHSRLQVFTSQQGGADRILSYGIKETQSLYSFIKFGLNGYLFELLPTLSSGFTFSSEKLYFSGVYFGEKWEDLGSGHTESSLEGAALFENHNNDVTAFCYAAISSWRVYHFHDTSDTAGVKRLGSLQDNIYLRSDASNLAAFLFKLKADYPEVYQQIIKVIRLALPYFADFVLNPQTLSSGEEQIRLLWQQNDSDYPLWPSQLSDGSLRFICLVTALMQPLPPSTIIIDEPELGLHPYAITLLGGLLRSAATRMQVIISTQSVTLLNEFQLDDLIIVERKDGASTFRRMNSADYSQWLEEYSVGELWEKNILGGRPRS